jgi:hypothetical protein
MSFTLASRRAEHERVIRDCETQLLQLQEKAQPYTGSSWECIRAMAEDRVQKLTKEIMEATLMPLEGIRLLQGEVAAWRKIVSLPQTIEANMRHLRERIQEARKELERLG